jgi:hypothetical protein
VLGFVIAFLAFAFGGALGLPESVSLLVIGVGVLLAVLATGSIPRFRPEEEGPGGPRLEFVHLLRVRPAPVL